MVASIRYACRLHFNVYVAQTYVTAMGRRISKDNIARWDAAKRRRKIQARKRGEAEDSDSVGSQAGELEDDNHDPS